MSYSPQRDQAEESWAAGGHAFISYAAEDQALVDEVMERLTAARIAVWTFRENLPGVAYPPWFSDEFATAAPSWS